MAALEAFNLSWAATTNLHIRSYGRELDKRWRLLQQMKVPCEDAVKVIGHVDTMNKSGAFKEEKLLKWENDPTLQG